MINLNSWDHPYPHLYSITTTYEKEYSRLWKAELDVQFLNRCKKQNVTPKFVRWRNLYFRRPNLRNRSPWPQYLESWSCYFVANWSVVIVLSGKSTMYVYACNVISTCVTTFIVHKLNRNIVLINNWKTVMPLVQEYKYMYSCMIHLP